MPRLNYVGLRQDFENLTVGVLLHQNNAMDGSGSPEPPTPVKAQIAKCFLSNTGTDLPRELEQCDPSSSIVFRNKRQRLVFDVSYSLNRDCLLRGVQQHIFNDI